MSHHSYDIVIVGGGNVGLTLACALAQQTRLSILILESQESPPAWQADIYHHRVSAIALSSQRIFKKLGVWSDIRSCRISPFRHIQVWDGSSNGKIHFSSHEIAEPALGYILENNLIQCALYAKIQHYPQITYLPGKTLTAYHSTDAHAELTTEDGVIIRCQLAVAADGARSWLREQANIDCHRHDYDQLAIVAAVKTAKPHEETARQVFLESGPLAFLPLAENNVSSIVWSLPCEQAKAHLVLDENAFNKKLAAAFSLQLGEVEVTSERHAFPLARQAASQYVLPRLALAGDAAHIVHPLAGQGVNMGLLDAASLAEIIIEADKQRRDIGGLSALRKYERWRKADNLPMLKGVDMIKSLFASDQSTVQRLRSTGMNAANQLGVIKNVFTRHAVGNRNGLPVLARS